MKKKILYVAIVSLIAAAASVVWAQNLTPGGAVWAEWTPNGWYHGKLSAACELGYTVNFDDGDVKCCEVGKIAPDVAPSKSQVTVGLKVVAEWTDRRYYPGTIAAIKGDQYNINFDDGDKRTVGIGQIRLLAK